MGKTTTGKRKAIGKKARFEIFERDNFTCQYCGKTPPEVTLHVDHIIPVYEGGTNDPENLRTSCSDCNLGKGKKTLGKQVNDKDSRRRAQEAMEAVGMAKSFSKASKSRIKLRKEVKEYIISLVDDDEIKPANVTAVINGIKEFGVDQTMAWLEKAAQIIYNRNGRSEEWSTIRYFVGILRCERKNREQ